MADIPPARYANLAIAHFMMGLVKADGYISQAEERKIEILVHKFSYGLPGEPDTIMDDIKLLRSAKFDKHMPIDHLNDGFVHFDDFVKTGQAEPDHMQTIVEMMDILSEVDGFSDSEKLYMERVRSGFKERYGSEG